VIGNFLLAQQLQTAQAQRLTSQLAIMDGAGFNPLANQPARTFKCRPA